MSGKRKAIGLDIIFIDRGRNQHIDQPFFHIGNGGFQCQVGGFAPLWGGLGQFYPHQAYQFSAEISIYLASDTQERGYGKQILNFIDQQITDNLDIKTVIAYVYENNLPSQKLFQKCGYQQCGVLPQISIIDGELRTLKIFVKHFNL